MRGWLGRFVCLLIVLMLGACGGPNTAPEHDRAISAGKPFLHSLDALVESDGPVDYTATLGDGLPLPEWLSFDPTTRTFRGVAPEDLSDGSTVRVQVVAADAGGTLAKTSFDLIVMQATGDVPVILNPAEELIEFDPKGLLRWSAVAGADAYEVWAYRDADLTQVQEFSGALESRQYQFTQLLGGQTYHVKIYFRAAGVWKEMPTFTIQTTSTVVKSRLTNSQEELEALGPSATLRWTAVQGADVYELWIYRDAALVAFAETSGPVRITQYQITTLTPGTTYYAQVYARVNGQFKAGGALTIKVTSQLDKARILNPQEELDNFATNGILRWSPVTGATVYELWVFTNPNSSEIYESSGSLTSRSYATRTLQPGKVYYAQAFSLVNGQWQVGSPVKITTASQVTQARLTNPQEELEAFATNGTLRWTEVQGATAYELWIYANAGLGVVVESGANPDRSYQVKKLCRGAIYYVQVHALVNGVWTVGWATRLDVTQGTSVSDCVPPAPQVRLTADPLEVGSGESVDLTWSTQFAVSCAASGAWSGAKSVSGHETVGPLTNKSLFVLTCAGQSGTFRAETLVTVSGSSLPNVPPTASFTASAKTGVAPLVVAFDASRSSDPDGSITKYEWIFADGGSATGVQVLHAFVTEGSFAVTLRVTDNRRGIATATQTITVRPIAAGARYSVTFLPSEDFSLDGSPDPAAINNKGEAVGAFYSERDGEYRAFLYTDGRTVNLGTLGGASSEAVGINNNGQIAGSSQAAGGGWNAFLYSNGSMGSLGSIGGNYTRAINASGAVVGGAKASDGSTRAFLYVDGVMRNLGTLGGNFSIAFGINGSGHIVGRSWVASGDGHAFVYRNGTMEDITPVSDSSSATSINDSGQVVGWSEVYYERGWFTTGFFYSNGAMTPIRMPSYLDDVYPLEINSSGQVVGRVDKYDRPSFGFLWDRVGGIRNLSDLIDPTLGCRIASAADINDFGQIVGVAYCNEGDFVNRDLYAGVLLTPIR